ncbi:hypothetical protein D3C84_1212260 [compost metagenome]
MVGVWRAAGGVIGGGVLRAVDHWGGPEKWRGDEDKLCHRGRATSEGFILVRGLTRE